MRISQLELDELTFDSDRFVEVGRRERMVRLRGGAEDARGQQDHRDDDSFHAPTPSLTDATRVRGPGTLEHTIGAVAAQLKIS